MKPRNEFERNVERWHTKLPPLSAKDIEQAVSNCFMAKAYVKYRTRHFCNMCGHVWEQKPLDVTTVCPHCGKTLSVEKTLKRKFDEQSFFTVLRVYKGIQVAQIYSLTRYYNFGGEIHNCIAQSMQTWLTADDRRAVISHNKKPYPYYCRDPFSYASNMTIKWYRKDWGDYLLFTETNIIKSVLPIFKKHGFSGDFYGFNAIYFLHNILYSPHFETLVKAKFWEFTNKYHEKEYLDKYWPQIKMCIRHNYHPEDVGVWEDVIEQLNKLELDTHNPKYVCPADLKGLHDTLTLRLENNKRKAELKKLLKENERFIIEKQKYFGIAIVSDDLQITVLDSVESYYDEAQQMHHCVFANKYYNKPDSLCLSAKDNNGNRLATVELSLKDFSVLQCRGKFNKVPERKEDIIGLLSAHKKVFRRAKKSA